MSRYALCAAVLLAACHPTQRTVGQPPGDVAEHAIRLVAHDKVDILFMIDDSVSMAPKQDALRRSFPSLLSDTIALAGRGLPASYHIGVITSDLGAGQSSACAVGGDGGRLQVAPGRSLPEAPAACASVSLGDGARYIEWDAGTNQSNVVGGDVTTAFSCMASVGDLGCGLESQLESIYRALHDPPPENAGFLRDDALLLIVLVTDEDDCSAPPDTDLFDTDAAANQRYGALTSFRCTQFGITCGGQPLDGTPGTFTDCAPRPMRAGGKLFDVDRYVTLFTADRAHGGLKDDPNDVVLVSLAAPPSPVGVKQSFGPVCPLGLSCPTLAHSCTLGSDVFGDPAVRIHAVLQTSANAVEATICADDYAQVLDDAANLMGDRMQPGCLPGAPVGSDVPACTVTVETTDGPATLPSCRGAQPPCWDVASDPSCPVEPDAAGRPHQLRFVTEGLTPDASVSARCLLYAAAR